MHIIFTTSVPFIKQHKTDLYYDALASNYTCDILDLSELFRRNSDIVSDSVNEAIKVNSLKQFQDILNNRVKKDKTIIVTNILINKLCKIYKIIKEFNIPIININKENFGQWLMDNGDLKLLPSCSIQKKLFQAITKHYRLRKMYKYFKYGNTKYDYVLANYNYYPEDCKSFIKIHDVKYEEYLESLNSTSIIKEPYILFIDSAYANHPMYESSKNKVDKDWYLKCLNNYFELLEKKYKLPVVISAHPKSNYDLNDFNGRQIIKYNTSNLITHCKFVIAHFSTSLIDAILLMKPIVILNSIKLLESAPKMPQLAGLKLADLINLDIVDFEKTDLPNLKVDKIIYQSFIDKYICDKKNEKINNSKLIIDFFNKLNK